MNAIFVGEKRSGKTTLAFHIALRLTIGGIVVFDPKKEFRDWPATVHSVAELQAAVNQKHRVIIWHVPSDKDAGESFDELADWILATHDKAMSRNWDRVGFHFTLLVDEAYTVQNHARINAKLMRILSQCRPEILNVFQTFQSIKNVNSDSRSRVSDWFLFTITLPSDLDRLEEFAMPEVIEDVRHLDEHEYIHFLNEKGKQSVEIVKEPETWKESLIYGEEKDMAERDDNKDKRDEFPTDGIRVMDHAGLNEAYQKYNRRKKDDSNSKYRQRSTDNVREGSSDNKRGGGKEIVFGARKSA